MLLRKIRRIATVIFIVVLVLIGLVLLPATQTFLGKRITSHISNRFGTEVSVEKIVISPFGYTILRDVLALDHKQDTLIYIGELRANTLRLNSVLQGSHNLGAVLFRDLKCRIITYQNEENSNINLFFDHFNTNNGKEKSKDSLYASSVKIEESSLSILDQNNPNQRGQHFSKINASIKKFAIEGDLIRGDIKDLSTNTNWNDLPITSLQGAFSYASTEMHLLDAIIQSNNSVAKLDASLIYPEEGLSYFADSVQIDLTIREGLINNKELRNFIPDTFIDNIALATHMQGTIQEMSILDLQATQGGSHISFSGKSHSLLDESKRQLSGNWTLHTPESTKLLPPSISPELKAYILRLGTIISRGRFSYENTKWKMKSTLNTTLGTLEANLLFDTKESKPTYKVDLKSNDFNIGSLTSVSSLGNSGFDLKFSGKGTDFSELNAEAKGKLTRFYYDAHIYDQVILEGNLNPKSFSGNLKIIDDALRLELDGNIDFASDVRNFSFTSTIEHADIEALGLSSDTSSGVFSGSIDLALQGNSIDEMIGDLYVEKGKLITPLESYKFSSVAIQSRLTNGIRIINLSSEDVANGLMIGMFNPSELVKLTQNAIGSQYKNYKPHPIAPNQYVDFNFNIKGKITEAIFGKGVILDDNTFISGKINPNKNLFQLQIKAPKFSVQDTDFFKLEAKIDSKNPLLYSFVSLDRLQSPRGSLLNINWINSRVNNVLYGRAEFTSAKTPDNINQFNTSFTIDDASQAVLGIQDADFYFNSKRWFLDKNIETPTLTVNNAGQFLLSTLKFQSGTSSISLRSSQQKSDSFSIGMELTEVQLEDLLPDGDDKWVGVVNGFLNIEKLTSGFSGQSNVSISNLHLNEIPLGKAILTLKSQEDQKEYQLAFRVEEANQEVILASGTFGFEDQQPIFDVSASFYDYNLSVLEGLTQGVFSSFKGNANGNLKIKSSDAQIDVNGKLMVGSFQLDVPYLNTSYSFSSVVPFQFEKDRILIQKSTFSSKDNNDHATLTGFLAHQSLSDWSLDIQIDAEDLNMLNTPFSEDALYYGKAFFNGNARLFGPFSNMQIDVVGQTSKGTNVFIPIQYDTAIGDVSFINFVQKEKNKKQEITSFDDIKGLQLNFDLDVTSDAQVEIVVDPETKSFLRGKGAGNLLLEIDTAGSFAIWGDFIALEGIYNFKNLGLIDKSFRLKPGGTIVWEGDPYGAQINMKAVYDVPGGANPAILLEGGNVSQKIPTEVTINLFGNLLNPETPTFEIDFPNTSGVIKNELNYRLNDQERRQLQAISLLSQGSFINEVSLAAISTQTLTNNLFQKASGVFDNIFSSKNDRLNFSLDYLQGDRNAAVSIKNRDRLGLSLSTNINERILIDGKVGVPVGSEEETTIVGDVKLEFLLNSEGSLRARIFNKENEFQYFGDELGYTQGLGVAYQVRFDSFQELIRKIFYHKK